MGAFDGAEVCELVGLYLLKQMEVFIPREQVGLYRDDGLLKPPKVNFESTTLYD